MAEELQINFNIVEANEAMETMVDDLKRRYLNDVRFNAIVTVLAQFMEESEVSADEVRQAVTVIERGLVPSKKKQMEEMWGRFLDAGAGPAAAKAAAAEIVAMSEAIVDSAAKLGQVVCIPDERLDLKVADVKDGVPICYCPMCHHATMCQQQGTGYYYCTRGCHGPHAPTGFDFSRASGSGADVTLCNPGAIYKGFVFEDRKAELVGTTAHISGTVRAADCVEKILSESLDCPISVLGQPVMQSVGDTLPESMPETPVSNPDGCYCESLMNGHLPGCPLAEKG